MEITDAAPEAAPAVVQPPPVPDLPPVPATPAEVAAVDAVIKESRRRPATLEQLMAKRRRETEVVVHSVDEDGGDVELVLKFRALSSAEYDELVAKYPPTPKQRADGLAYDPDKFASALVAAVCYDPVLSVADVTALLKSDTWSPGEGNSLSGTAFALCQQGAGIPFNVSG